ncbi:hypothetical protein BT69DRAFT_649352 [Atractiella rhizophila]|nr:hypothetical protein BT69DRAFT_649352 [Atractiella rhizophila]
MDRAKVPGRIRSFAGQIGSSWEEEGYKHSFSYSVPTNVKEIVILTSSLYFLDGIMLSPDSKPWSGTRPSYLSSSATKNDGKQRKLRGRKYTFSGTLPAPQARIITSHKPSSSWFRKRTYPAAVDWDLFKAVESQERGEEESCVDWSEDGGGEGRKRLIEGAECWTLDAGRLVEVKTGEEGMVKTLDFKSFPLLTHCRRSSRTQYCSKKIGKHFPLSCETADVEGLQRLDLTLLYSFFSLSSSLNQINDR